VQDILGNAFEGNRVLESDNEKEKTEKDKQWTDNI
jgi:hypothetical protein